MWKLKPQGDIWSIPNGVTWSKTLFSRKCLSHPLRLESSLLTCFVPVEMILDTIGPWGLSHLLNSVTETFKLMKSVKTLVSQKKKETKEKETFPFLPDTE